MTSDRGYAAVTPAGGLMPGFDVPAGLARNVAEDAEHGSARRAWLEALPRTVAGLADRWSLAVGRPFQPGGSASWAAPVRDAAGRRLVLKAGWPPSRSRRRTRTFGSIMGGCSRPAGGLWRSDLRPTDFTVFPAQATFGS